jgi:hypothetical protein
VGAIKTDTKKRKYFFFEKKKEKLLLLSARCRFKWTNQVATFIGKVFWFFFSKKELLSCPLPGFSRSLEYAPSQATALDFGGERAAMSSSLTASA